VNRKQYLEQIIESYLDSPDTPTKARKRDWAIATTFYQHGIDLATFAHAVRFITLRRHRRDPDLETLEPIHSLAYFRSLVQRLHREPHDPDYVEYVRWSYENRLDWPTMGKPSENGG
jgi:hypothetical protein